MVEFLSDFFKVFGGENMFRKGLILITSIVVVSAFVACEKQTEQASVSESVAEATEKQMQPVGNEAETNGNEAKEPEAKEPEATEGTTEGTENGENGKAEEKAKEKTKEMNSEEWSNSDASQIPSIDSSKLEQKSE